MRPCIVAIGTRHVENAGSCSGYALADDADRDAHAIEVIVADVAARLEPVRGHVQLLGQRPRRDLTGGSSAPPLALQGVGQREDDLFVEALHDVADEAPGPPVDFSARLP